MPSRRNPPSIGRDCAFIRYMTATSRARNFASSSSARRGSAPLPPAAGALTLPAVPPRLPLLFVALEALAPQATLVRRPELLVLPRVVVRDDRVGRVEDQLGRAVGLFQLHDRRVRPVPLAVEDGADV